MEALGEEKVWDLGREGSAGWTPVCPPAGDGGKGEPEAGWDQPCLLHGAGVELEVILSGHSTTFWTEASAPAPSIIFTDLLPSGKQPWAELPL